MEEWSPGVLPVSPHAVCDDVVVVMGPAIDLDELKDPELIGDRSNKITMDDIW